MRITDLNVVNFRAISSLKLSDLSDVVVLAGPNGCGKSCVLDAIRLLKSAYGSYQQDEWQTWFGEFQINIAQDSKDYMQLFQHKAKPITIEATFVLAESEKEYLRTNLSEMLEIGKWADLNPGPPHGRRVVTSLARTQRAHAKRIRSEAEKEAEEILELVNDESLAARIVLHPEGRPDVRENALLETIFRTYQPANLGIIDYHSATRNYTRERIGNINLTIEEDDQRLKQHALYNSANKYSNLKSQMAGAYVRNLVMKDADPSALPDDTLIDSLKELFKTFFPGKTFLGAKPTAEGRLLFPVKLPGGIEHDIDELSAGEKEVVYGYLRLRSAAPKNSIIMIDEPELHLNPRLIVGLADFYHRHIGKALGNQLWLITHSDTLIRESVARAEFSVFHVQPIGKDKQGGQATRVKADAEVERLVIELVGDLAAYRPGAKVVIFESTSDVAFDSRMTFTLFPELRDQINPICGGDKARVQSLYNVLEQVRAAGQLHVKIFAITDPDDSPPHVETATTRLQWDAYHIENYLLESRYILKVCNELNISSFKNTTEIEVQLVEIAKQTISELVSHRLRSYTNKELISSFDLRIDADALDVTSEILRAIASSSARLNDKLSGKLAHATLTEMERKWRTEYEEAVKDGTWRQRFRGRTILKAFVKRFVSGAGAGVQYEPFRDLVLARMHDDGHKPPGMQKVISQILAQ